jgi:hypothetical membrane protein
MKMNKKIKKILTTYSTTAPIFFLILIAFLGFLFPDYNHLSQYISELGAVEAPHAIILNAIGFPILGLSVLTFSICLYFILNQEKNTFIKKTGSMLIGISGIAFILIGFFPCDPNCINESTIGILHGHISNIAQFSLIFSTFFIYQYNRNNHLENTYLNYTLLTGVIGLIMGVIYKANIFEDLTGLMQRISFGIPLIWTVIMSTKLIKNC